MQNNKLVLLTIVSVLLFLGGIILLLAHLSVWSYILGIPATQIGIVFLILTFEKLSSRSLDDDLKEKAQKSSEEENY